MYCPYVTGTGLFKIIRQVENIVRYIPYWELWGNTIGNKEIVAKGRKRL
jgi:hypothetical protein